MLGAFGRQFSATPKTNLEREQFEAIRQLWEAVRQAEARARTAHAPARAAPQNPRRPDGPDHGGRRVLSLLLATALTLGFAGTTWAQDAAMVLEQGGTGFGFVLIVVFELLGITRLVRALHRLTWWWRRQGRRQPRAVEPLEAAMPDAPLPPAPA